MKKLKNLKLRNKRVLVRCDFNVPLDEQGNILDDFRISQSLETINYLIKKKAKVILMSHLGRPQGKVVEKLRLEPIRARLQEYLRFEITQAPDCIGQATKDMVNQMKPDQVLLLENLRFHQEEKENDDNFSRVLASLGDVYINDAFGVSHREHASVVGITKYLPSVLGFLLEKEIVSLSHLIKNPKRPVVAVIGGSKVETKIKMIDKISLIADFVLIGGLLNKAIMGEKIKLVHPEKIIVPVDETGGGKDIGSRTAELFREKIMSAKTVFFNGVLGMVEKEEFSFGTEEILSAIIESQAFSVVGGGDMTGIINKLNMIDKFNHVSTGGGAMLAFLSGDKLPGIEALKNNG
ncbi:MAG: phosphoglycerate kinase [Candidatus Nealsonbacteria bacterium]